MQHVPLPLLAAGFLLLASAAAAPQGAEIRGARIALVSKAIEVEHLAIENRHSSPLVAWELRWPAAGGGASIAHSDFSSSPLPRLRGEGPIQPGERRMLTRPNLADMELGPVALQLAVFADGYLTGAPDAVERWLRRRREHADDAAYWIRAFEAMPSDTEGRAKEYLASRIVERTSQAPGDPSRTRGELAALWHDAPRRPGSLFDVVHRLHAEAQQEHAALTRILAAARTSEGPAPLVISSERTTATQYVAAVTNLRNVPIEALGFSFVPVRHHRLSSSQSTDFCMAAPGDPRGRLAPGETREFHPGTEFTDAAELPIPRLTYVLFDDLSFEGTQAELERVFRQREEQADDIGFVNAVRHELAAVPDDKLQEFLISKRAERTAQLLAAGRRPEHRRLDELIDHAKRSPAQLRQNVPVMIAGEAEQRQRLLRHRQ